MLPDRTSGLVDHRVLGLAPLCQREIEARERELDPDHVGRKRAQALLEKLLPGLVPLEHDDRPLVHRRRMILAPIG